MNKNEGNITLLEAIETLSAIAELKLDDEITVAETGEVTIGERQAIEWLNLRDEDETVQVIRSIFSLIHKYIEGVYADRKTEEGVVNSIKTIMVFVGEAAKKLDNYTELFHWAKKDKITGLPEYQKLQRFYNDRISKQVDSRQLSKWILGLAHVPAAEVKTQLKGRVKKESEHVYVDLDAVKKDSEYELFYIRKEDGSRFFNPQLIRNITLVCDFGSVIGSSETKKDPLLQIRHWQDVRMRGSARALRNFINPMLSRFYRETNRHKNKELVNHLTHAVMALMLSSNPANEIRDDMHRKSCFDYFADFLYFLRAGLCSRDYQKMIAYPPNKQNKLAYAQLDLIHALCYGFFHLMSGDQHLTRPVHELIDLAKHAFGEGAASSDQMWNRLNGDFAAMTKLMRHHPNGPLMKILHELQEGNCQFFDPIWQHNIPSQLFCLYLQEQRIANVRMPCPIHQEYINKALINEELKGFLRALKESPVVHRHLIINFQDRTSWREHARCKAIEELQQVSDFSDQLSVVTLSKDSDFYHQHDPYETENHATIFIATFVQHLEDESCGYHFPGWILEKLSPQFFHGVTDAVHRVFFNSKNVLTKEQRLDFIEITYFFIELKLLELVKPGSFSLMCKDGIDVSTCANVFFFVMTKMINQEPISKHDQDTLALMLYAEPLVMRERVVLSDRFGRMISALRTVEALKAEVGPVNFAKIVHEAFGRYYGKGLLDGLIVPSNPE